MLEKLKRWWKGAPPPVAQRLEDPILGTLKWSEDDEAWLTQPGHANCPFELQIAGTPAPDPELLRHAFDILRHKEEFAARVTAFLQAEIDSERHMRHFREEIESLAIESVLLCWEGRPDDGMIYFSGGKDYRLWRCDYVGRTPKGLGFDS